MNQSNAAAPITAKVAERRELLVRLTCAILSGNADIAPAAAADQAVKALDRIEQRLTQED